MPSVCSSAKAPAPGSTTTIRSSSAKLTVAMKFMYFTFPSNDWWKKQTGRPNSKECSISLFSVRVISITSWFREL